MFANISLHKSPQTVIPVFSAKGLELMENDNPLSVFTPLPPECMIRTIYGDSWSPVSR